MTRWRFPHIALVAVALLWTAAAQVQAGAKREPMIITPTVEGLLLCEEVIAQKSIVDIERAYTYCDERGKSGAKALERLLDTLEPGGAEGTVQVGYTLTLQLLSLFQETPQGWAIDTTRLERHLDLIRQVDRPVVVYLAADHFDSRGPLPAELARNPDNLMLLADGKPPELGYFGYRILPYTLSTDPAIALNRYRLHALNLIAQRVKALPQKAQERIVAFTLAGELHHLFPDFENGMGAFQNIHVTDYSPRSTAGFRVWLQSKYMSVARLNAATGFDFASFDQIDAPARDIRRQRLGSFAEHYDSFAAGTLPIAGWLWDPARQIDRLDLYVDAQYIGPVSRGMNRLDVYRAVKEITSPNTGYRHDFDFRALPPGRHVAQVIASSHDKRYQLAELPFTVVPRNQSPVSDAAPDSVKGLPDAKRLKGVRSWLDLPSPHQDVYYNPLAREWNMYRESQVFGFLKALHAHAIQAGLPAQKLFSHQIVPKVNSSWNAALFALGSTLGGATPWRQGLNMYGGATDSAWLRQYMRQRNIRAHGAPEFHPQQWKRPNAALKALQSHYAAGARFISPYYFSIIPRRFKGGPAHGVNRMEITPGNSADGSDQFYRAIVEFAKR